jgi:uncharacterized protein (TIGR02145 family)
MGKDLRSGRFKMTREGIPPADVRYAPLSQEQWRLTLKPARAWVEFHEDDNEKAGMVLYNWFAAVDLRGICPDPRVWRVPSVRDWDTLMGHLGGENVTGGRLKSRRTSPPLQFQFGWRAPNETSDDAGFNGFPAGRRSGTGAMDFLGVGIEAVWWSSETASPTAYRAIFNRKRLEKIDASQQDGFSVRCVTAVPRPRRVAPPAVESCPTMGPLVIESIGSDRVGVRGEVLSNGNAPVTARGVVYGTSPEPVFGIASSVPAGSGTGPFTRQIPGLTPSTTYYARAYGTNRRGTCYGPPSEITTSPPPLSCPAVATEQVEQIGINQARVRGRIVSDGGAAVTNQGIVWGMSPNPTLSDSSTSALVQDGVFRGNLLGLSSATTYHARAFATNSVGTCYGASVPLTTLSPPPVCPIVTTMAVEAVGPNWVKAKGRVDSDGGAAVTARGVVWGPSPAPIIGPGQNSTNAGPGTGEFSTQYEGPGLSPNTSYYVRAYATNSAGTCYGASLSFSTLPLPASCPTVVTNEVVETQLGRARVRGTVTSANGGEVTARGVVYGTSADPTIDAAAPISAIDTADVGVGPFERHVMGLAPATTYYARAYATNSGGTCYGASRQLTTPTPQSCPAHPTVTDRSGNEYATVQIGLQCWMKQNLRTEKYRDDSPIVRLLPGPEHINAPADTAAFIGISDPSRPELELGKLYTHAAATSGKLCPTDWRVPSEGDWNVLATYLDPQTTLDAPADISGFQRLSSWAGGALKSGVTFEPDAMASPLYGWKKPNAAGPNPADDPNAPRATDASGFSALPAGRISAGQETVELRSGTGWWTSGSDPGSGKGWYRTVQFNNGSIQRRADLRKTGFSVRCLKN